MLIWIFSIILSGSRAEAQAASKVVGAAAPPAPVRSLNMGEVLEREMRVSEALSDHYRAYRIGLAMRARASDQFSSSGLVPFLESVAAVGSVSDLEIQCSRLTGAKVSGPRNLALLTCGRIMLELNDLGRAQKFLERVEPSSKHAVAASIYLASLYLGRGDGDRCTKLLSPALRKRVKNPNIRDLFHMTRARCFIEVSQFDSAVLEYQLISPTSQYYYDSLEETAWSQFRTRRLESARTLLDVIITTYETGLGQSRSVSPGMYFRARYLQSYIELVENNVSHATSQFEALEQAISQYMKPRVEELLKARDIAKKIVTENSKWIDMKAMPLEVRQFIETISDWSDASVRKNIDRIISLQFALTREKDRFKTEGEFSGYAQTVEKLGVSNAMALETELVAAARGAAKAMRVLKIKSDLGRIEIKWVERTQGVRSIDELLESYKREVDEVEDHLTL